MKISGNTIFITGGASGIGHALAEALHKAGNKVIIASRRKALLDSVTQANPGMDSVVLDVTTVDGIHAAVAEAIRRFPHINVVINNAGIMQIDDASRPLDEQQMVDIVSTNLLGPMRLTSAFVEHLKHKKDAVIMYVTSVLGFVPLAPAAVYSATKAAMHSYAMSQRFMLRDSGIRVLEIVPPWVQTDLLNSNEEPRAMPLKPFIEETMAVLATDAEEVLVERAHVLRSRPGPGEMAFVHEFNSAFLSGTSVTSPQHHPHS
jgi:uncharacterized oxidoreductase